MLKAKAKAAATAAAQKRKAAAAAAAAQEAAAQQAAAANNGVGVSTTRSGRGIRPAVTQYWADSASTVLAPGGSIQRIGYDTAAFEEAVRVIILGQDPSVETELSKVGIIETVKAVKEKKEEEAVEGYKTNKEDLAVVTSALSVPPALASQTLRQHKGDLVAALEELSAPVPVQV